MKRIAVLLAAGAVVLVGCELDFEDRTHEAGDGRGAYVDADTDCIMVMDPDGTLDQAYAPRGESISTCTGTTSTTTTTQPSPSSTLTTATTTVSVSSSVPPTSDAPSTVAPVDTSQSPSSDLPPATDAPLPTEPTTTPPTVPATTVPAPTTTVDPDPSFSPDAFVETFDDDTGLDRFDRGVFHRDNEQIRQTQWSGDHDLACNGPETQRTVHRNAPDESFWTCKNHLMISMGHASSYDVVWFSPKQTFNGQTSVAWDVNSTYLGTRTWWEVALVPADWNGGPVNCRQCSAVSWLTATGLPAFPANSLVVGSGPFGQDKPKLSVKSAGVNYEARDLTWQHICKNFPLDPEGCASKPIRRPWSVVDNENGTVTVSFNGTEWTQPGAFPTGDWKMIVKGHWYTPLKDGPIAGTTFHFDNISVT